MAYNRCVWESALVTEGLPVLIPDHASWHVTARLPGLKGLNAEDQLHRKT